MKVSILRSCGRRLKKGRKTEMDSPRCRFSKAYNRELWSYVHRRPAGELGCKSSFKILNEFGGHLPRFDVLSASEFALWPNVDDIGEFVYREIVSARSRHLMLWVRSAHVRAAPRRSSPSPHLRASLSGHYSRSRVKICEVKR